MHYEPYSARFWMKVNWAGLTEPAGCWEWAASKTQGGYGQFRLYGRLQVAHRVAYELLIGPVPDGLELDHLCRNPACVNPGHLEPVTAAENNRRKTPYCRHGHANAAREHCAPCRRDAQRKRRARQNAAA